jgi:hypothetical protein
MKKHDLPALAAKMIDKFGGDLALAIKLGYSRQRVSHWRKVGVPKRQVAILCAQLEIRPCLIRPDLWDKDALRPDPARSSSQ